MPIKYSYFEFLLDEDGFLLNEYLKAENQGTQMTIQVIVVSFLLY